MIYHITTQEDYEAALKSGNYEASSLQDEGFIHLCEEDQIDGVRNRYYKSRNNLILLHVEEGKLTVPLRYELSPSINESFPHAYGPINVSAIIKTSKLGI